MVGVTLTVALVASFLVFFLRPIYGLIIYIAAFAWYPTYVTVPVGTIDFTVRRIVMLALFAKLFLQTDLPDRFKLMRLDKLIIIYFGAQILAGATTTRSLMAFLENRGGAVFDMLLPYFAVRMIIRNKQQYLTLLKGVLIIAAPLAIAGFYQCITGDNPVGFFKKYYAWGRVKRDVPIPRAGFFRADITFSHSIMYGLFFSMLGPICAGLLRHVKKGKHLYAIGIGLMGVGVFSSVSAGPWLGTLLAILFIVLYFYRRHWRIAVLLAILMSGMVEIIGSRHFYKEIDRFTFSGHTARHRVRLMEVALLEGGMRGHWLTGFGWGVDPGWMSVIYPGDERSTDITNHYLVVLCRFGLAGLVPFLAVMIVAAKKLIDSYKAAAYKPDMWLVWCLSAALFGSAASFLGAYIFGPPTTVYYIMIGLCGAMPAVVTRSRATKTIAFFRTKTSNDS